MLCPWCEHDNPPGEDLCVNCRQDLTHLDRPVPQDRVERSLMEDPVLALAPRRPITLTPDATVGQAMRVMLDRDIGAVLVVDRAGQLLGVFSERDLLLKVAGLGPGYADRPISDFMTRRPETIRDGDSLAFALHKMDCGGFRHLPTLRDGQLAGMVSVRDLLRHITRLVKNC
jgi:CBS domain-containing protein